MSFTLASSSELVLRVNERSRFRPGDRFSAERRAAARRLSAVAAQLERSTSHRGSMRRVLDRAAQFQRMLDPAQRASWLSLEDALLEHAWREKQAYFRAGVEFARDMAAFGSSRRAGS